MNKKWHVCRDISDDRIEGYVCTRTVFSKYKALELMVEHVKQEAEEYPGLYSESDHDWTIEEDTGFFAHTFRRGYTNSRIFFPLLK